MKYLIYARVSPRGSDYDGDTSIQMQIDYCKQYINLKGGEIAGERYDEFFSGKDTKRPAFQSILDELEEGAADWDCLIVYKLSRMSRSLKDGAVIFEKLFQNGKGFVSATENYDFSSPAGRAMLGMMQVFNQFEREQTAENTRNKMISIAQKGEWPVGNPPFGYKRGEKRDNKLYVDERKAAIVRDVFDMYISGKPINEILRKYRDFAGPSSVWYMLRNRTYLGKIIYASQEYEGKHESLVSQAIFERAKSLQPTVKDGYQDRPKSQTYPYLLTGIFYCHCGARMTPKSAKSGKFNYYTCRNQDCKYSVNAKKVEAALIDYLKTLKISKKQIQEAYQVIEEEQRELLVNRQPEIDQLNVALRIAEREMENLVNTIVSGLSKLSESVLAILNARSEVLSREISNLKMRTELINNENLESEFLSLEFMISLVKDLESLTIEDFHKSPTHAKQIVNACIGELRITPNLDYQIYPPKSSPNTQKWLRRLDSNQGPSG